MTVPRSGHAVDTDVLLTRLSARASVSPRHLAPPGPDAAQWQQAIALAAHAPDHGRLRPCRFAVVEPVARVRLAELFAQDAQARGEDAAGIERARERALAGPGLAALIARIVDDAPNVPAHEQWITVGAALMNLLNALHLMGFGAKVLSGNSVRGAAVRSALCEEGESLAAWIVVGRVSVPEI